MKLLQTGRRRDIAPQPDLNLCCHWEKAEQTAKVGHLARSLCFTFSKIFVEFV
jgi:hypothetical protein